MKRKNWLKLGLGGLILAGSLYFLANKQDYLDKEFQNQNQKPLIVKVGEGRYNQGNLVSYDFVRCSAVVFDYGENALMAHALPLLAPEFDFMGKKLITSGGVVDYLINESKKYGLNPDEAEVYVNSGDQISLDKIIETLESSNLTIKEGKFRFKEGYNPQSSDSRIVLYDPHENKLSVFKDSEFPDYRNQDRLEEMFF